MASGQTVPASTAPAPRVLAPQFARRFAADGDRYQGAALIGERLLKYRRMVELVA